MPTGAADGDGAGLTGAWLAGTWLGVGTGADRVGDAAVVQPTIATRAVAIKGTIQRHDPWVGAWAVIGFPLVG